jgi:hypothetical protein
MPFAMRLPRRSREGPHSRSSSFKGECVQGLREDILHPFSSLALGHSLSFACRRSVASGLLSRPTLPQRKDIPRRSLPVRGQSPKPRPAADSTPAPASDARQSCPERRCGRSFRSPPVGFAASPAAAPARPLQLALKHPLLHRIALSPSGVLTDGTATDFSAPHSRCSTQSPLNSSLLLRDTSPAFPAPIAVQGRLPHHRPARPVQCLTDLQSPVPSPVGQPLSATACSGPPSPRHRSGESAGARPR